MVLCAGLAYGDRQLRGVTACYSLDWFLDFGLWTKISPMVCNQETKAALRNQRVLLMVISL